MNLKDYVANVPNFPKEGIQFKDITPLMADGAAYSYATTQMVEFAKTTASGKLLLDQKHVDLFLDVQWLMN